MNSQNDSTETGDCVRSTPQTMRCYVCHMFIMITGVG